MGVSGIASTVKKAQYEAQKPSTTHSIVSLVDKKDLLSASENEKESFMSTITDWKDCRYLKVLNNKEHCTQFITYCKKEKCPSKFRRRKE